MDFTAFWEFVKWILPIGVGGLFWLVWRLNDNMRTEVRDHSKEDDDRHREMLSEMSAIRQQMTAFQLEVAKNYVTVADVGDIERGLRADLHEIKQDVKELIARLIPGRTR